MTQQARLDSWGQAPSKRFTAADHALTACLNQLNLTAMAGVLLPQTMLYKASDQKQQRSDNKFFAAAKRLKLGPHDAINHGQPQRDNDNPGGSPRNPSPSRPPPRNNRRHEPQNNQPSRTGDII